jgi:hypothetical protein
VGWLAVYSEEQRAHRSEEELACRSPPAHEPLWVPKWWRGAIVGVAAGVAVKVPSAAAPKRASDTKDGEVYRA